MKSALILSLILLVTLTSAVPTPSSLIRHTQAPQVIDLEHLDPNSSASIDILNPSLGPWIPMGMPNLGHWASDTSTPIVQGVSNTEGVPTSLLNFSKTTESIPPSIGNPTGNITILGGNNTGLDFIYL
jgi:hypothetical protein